MSPWYLNMGLASLCLHFAESYVKPKGADWTKMPNPFSPEFQTLIFVGLAVHVFLWPLVWIGRALELIVKALR